MSPRLLRGDCCAQLARLPVGTCQLTITSPPYNVGWDYAGDETGDRLPLGEYLALLRRVLAEVLGVTRDGGVLCLNLPPSIRTATERSFPLAAWAELEMRAAGWLLRESIEWVKSRPGAPVRATTTAIGNYKNPFLRHCRERVLVGSKGVLQIPDRSPRWPGDNGDWGSYLELCKDVWVLPPGRARRGEPLRFPDALVQGLVYLYSTPGDVVLDPFAGTGTVGQIARKMGRDCLLIERNPRQWPALEAMLGQSMLHDATDAPPTPIRPKIRSAGQTWEQLLLEEAP